MTQAPRPRDPAPSDSQLLRESQADLALAEKAALSNDSEELHRIILRMHQRVTQVLELFETLVSVWPKDRPAPSAAAEASKEPLERVAMAAVRLAEKVIDDRAGQRAVTGMVSLIGGGEDGPTQE